MNSKGEKRTPVKKAVRKVHFLSPSSNNICIICIKRIDDKETRIRLWKPDGRKTKYCELIEETYNKKLYESNDLKIICRNCYRKISRNVGKFQGNQMKFELNREEIKSKYQRTKVKRLSVEVESLSSTPRPNKHRKTLFAETYAIDNTLQIMNIEACEEDFYQVTIKTNEADEEIFNLPKNRHRLTKLVCTGNSKNILNYMSKMYPEEFLIAAKTCIEKELKNEMKTLCKKDRDSSFKIQNVEDIKDISFKNQLNELEKDAPCFLSILKTCSFNQKQLRRNKMKTEESLTPCLMTAAGILLQTRNKMLNANAVRNSIILRRGKADKMCITRFKSLNICLSYTALLAKQLELCKNYDRPVLELRELLSNDLTHCKKEKAPLVNMEIPLSMESSNTATRMQPENFDDSFFDKKAHSPSFSLLNEEHMDMDTDESFYLQDLEETFENLELEDFNIECDPGENKISYENDKQLKENTRFGSKFTIVGDNVDLRIKQRHMTKKNQNKDLHLYHMIAVKNRIPFKDEIIGFKPDMYDGDPPLDYFIPSRDDEVKFTEELKILILRDLLNYVPEIKWANKYNIKHIAHEYSDLVKEKSEVYPLGVLNQNETTTEGIIEIMKEQHKYVPGTKTQDKLNEENNKGEILRTLCVGDLLTVEREMNAQEDLQDSPTPSERLEGLIPVLADFHSYGNFLEVVWHILYDTTSSADIGTLYQARNFLSDKNVPSSPMSNVNVSEDLMLKYTEALLITSFQQFATENKIDLSVKPPEDEEEQFLSNLLTNFIKQMVLPEIPDFSKNLYKCPSCGSSYKRIQNYRKHLLKHPDLKDNEVNDDFSLNYLRNAMALGYIVKDFIDARKHGDGERIMRLYKYLLLFFKIDSRTKYSFHVLHLLAQVSILLPPALAHEIIWNRFVNNKGFVDSNVELDREIEHRNKYVKADLGQYQGKVTEHAIDRCSKSYHSIQEIIDLFDEENRIKPLSGKHSKASWVEDVLELSEQYSTNEIFKNFPGRSFSKFPLFPSNYLSKLSILEFKKWVYEKLSEFKRKNIYQNEYITA